MDFDKNAPLYVISDLHLGDHGPRDNFTRIGLVAESGDLVSRPEQFRRFLEMVQKDGGNLLVLGDMFELWQSTVGDVFSKNIKLLDEISKTRHLVIILGNHDMDLLGLVSCKDLNIGNAHPIFSKIHVPGKNSDGGEEIYTCKFGELTYGFIHGNEIDHYNNDSVPGIGRAITILAGIIEDSVGGPYLPESNKLVEEDLLEKVDLLKLGALRFVWKLLASRKIYKTVLVSSLWVVAVFFTGYTIATSQMYANIPFFLAISGTIFLPVFGVLVFLRHVYHVVADATTEAGGSVLKYLSIWRKKLPESQTATGNKDEKVVAKDRNLLEELRLSNKCDMIFMGHTHADDLRKGLCNSGTWANATPSYAKILPDGSIELYRWQAVDAAEGRSVLRRRFDAATREIIHAEPFNNSRT